MDQIVKLAVIMLYHFLLMSHAASINSCPKTVAVINLPECRRVFANYTEGNPLYSHSELFGTTATPKDVEAFKFYCTVNLMMSLIRKMNIPLTSASNYLTQCNMQFNHSDITVHLVNLLSSATGICQYYSTVKAYQYMLHRFLHCQQKTEVSNATITSILYLLQSAGESLQSAQFFNYDNYCTDFVGEEEQVYHILVSSGHRNIESVLIHLKNRRDWRLYARLHNVFCSSPCMNYSTQRCHFYTSLYRSVMDGIAM